MKPRTKLQIRISELTQEIPHITSEQEIWAKHNCLLHLGYATVHRVICFDCGGRFSTAIVKNDKAICPHCKAKLTIKKSAARKATDWGYFAIATIKHEFQVIRYYRVFGKFRDGQKAEKYCYPIFENWILPDGKNEIIGKLHNTQGYADSWHGDWEIRSRTTKWGYDKYDISVDRFHPSSKFKTEYLKYGINSKLQVMSFLTAIRVVPNNPQIETLLKTGLYNLLERLSDVARYWSSVKICIRNGYKPVDGGMWFDYLGLLERFNRDLHNPKYVCPKNLKAEHDRYVQKHDERLRKEELEKKRAQIEREQPKYEKRIGKLLGLQFSDGKITIKVLESVMEFYEEGKKLKHCVFSSDYYKKSDSLILSARIDNVPIETIEVSLSKMKIAQSRGLQNTPSKYNKAIVSLVTKNLENIKKMYHQQTA